MKMLNHHFPRPSGAPIRVQGQSIALIFAAGWTRFIFYRLDAHGDH